jgi:hypothetical protein
MRIAIDPYGRPHDPASPHADLLVPLNLPHQAGAVKDGIRPPRPGGHPARHRVSCAPWNVMDA